MNDYSGSILLSLRRIIHYIDQHNKHLGAKFNLTVPQLVCIRQLQISGPMTSGELARSVFLSQATLTGILDRLETKSLVERTRSTVDRRKIHISLTEKGNRLARDIPWLLQERFASRLGKLSEPDQKRIDQVLKDLVELMEVPPIDIWPYGGDEAFDQESRD